MDQTNWTFQILIFYRVPIKVLNPLKNKNNYKSHPIFNPGLFTLLFVSFHGYFKSYSVVDRFWLLRWRGNVSCPKIIELELFYSCWVVNGWRMLYRMGWDLGHLRRTCAHVDVHHVGIHVHVNVHCDLRLLRDDLGLLGNMMKLLMGLTVAMMTVVGLRCVVGKTLRRHEVISMQRLLEMTFCWWRFWLVW